MLQVVKIFTRKRQGLFYAAVNTLAADDLLAWQEHEPQYWPGSHGMVPTSHTRRIKIMHKMVIIIPLANKVDGGHTGFTQSVRPPVCVSVCRRNRVHSVSCTILARSISYLHILSTNFRRCATCWVCETKKPRFEFDEIFYFMTSCSSLLWMSRYVRITFTAQDFFHFWYGNSPQGEVVSDITLVTVPH